MKHSIIFHIPKPIETDSVLGSKVRPYKLINAFAALGCDVELVQGTSFARKKKIIEVIKKIENGKQYSFMYSESSNAPIPVSDSRHLPLTPVADYVFFKTIRQNRINSGVYYRDVYWKFPVFRRKLSLPIKILTLPLYNLDWMMYTKYINHMFIPSISMKKYLHTQWPEDRISVLPPGCDINDCENSQKKTRNDLTCFYVGGILPPLYDLKSMFETFASMESAHLTVCCRQDEWQNMKDYYGSNQKNITVIHEYGQGLKKYFCNSDLFILSREKDPYLEITMPIKILESLGYSLPVLITEGSEAARFVSRENIGWVIKDSAELKNMLLHLKNNRNEISEKKNNAKQVRLQHTWTERARQIIATLSPS